MKSHSRGHRPSVARRRSRRRRQRLTDEIRVDDEELAVTGTVTNNEKSISITHYEGNKVLLA